MGKGIDKHSKVLAGTHSSAGLALAHRFYNFKTSETGFNINSGAANEATHHETGKRISQTETIARHGGEIV
jgi:hypothetical protein